jgi:thiamine pyrophosphate-dependent acetolactate synthase large subunit-like protein
MQRLDTDYESREWRFPPARARIVPAEAEVEHAVGVIASARRPIVLAGRGAVDEEARAAMLRLAARLEAPVATTLKAKGLFRGETQDIGIFGTLSSPAAVDAILKSDCVIAFGAGLNTYTTSHGGLMRGKRVVQVSRERADIGRGLTPDAGVVGDVLQSVEAFVHWLDEAEIAPSGFVREVLAVGPDDVLARTVPAQAEGTVDYVEALSALNGILPANRVMVTDAGRFLIKMFQTLDVETPRVFLQTAAFGSIGLGMACAIGAGVAEPRRPVVLVTGDGGFMLGGLQEFHSAVRNRSDLIVLVCNDGSYGAEHVQLRDKQMDPSIVMFDWPDFARVAEVLGGTGVTVRSMADMAKVEQAVAEGVRPLLIDLRLDPDNMSVPM